MEIEKLNALEIREGIIKGTFTCEEVVREII